MNLILTADGERLREFALPDTLELPDKIQQFMLCSGCGKTHLVVYKRTGIHDDGQIYDLEGIYRMPDETGGC